MENHANISLTLSALQWSASSSAWHIFLSLILRKFPALSPLLKNLSVLSLWMLFPCCSFHLKIPTSSSPLISKQVCFYYAAHVGHFLPLLFALWRKYSFMQPFFLQSMSLQVSSDICKCVYLLARLGGGRCLFVWDFWLCLQLVDVPGPRIKPKPQQWPGPLQWPCQILNPPHHRRLLACLLVFVPSFIEVKLTKIIIVLINLVKNLYFTHKVNFDFIYLFICLLAKSN